MNKINRSSVIQHYVPQSTLRPFCTRSSDKEQIYVFDKQDRRLFSSHIKNVAAERYFYNYVNNGQAQSIESELSNLETNFSNTITRIRATRNLSGLSAKQRDTIAKFVLTQRLRTAALREQLRSISQQFVEEVKTRSGDTKNTLGVSQLSSDEAKTISINIVSNVSYFMPYVRSKSLILYENRSTKPFIISNNPVSLHNALGGDIGFGVEGIEISLPISPDLLLSFVCEQLVSELRRLSEQGRREESAKQLIDAIDSGDPLSIDQEYVEHFNGRQVVGSERWLFSEQSDFSEAEEILRLSSTYRYGPRPYIVKS